MLQINDLVIVLDIPKGRKVPNSLLGTKGRISHVSETKGRRRYNLILENNPSKIRKLALFPAYCLEKVNRPRFEKAVTSPLNEEIRKIRKQLQTTRKFGQRIVLHKRLAHLLSQSKEMV
jgi:hypothetical protein